MQLLSKLYFFIAKIVSSSSSTSDTSWPIYIQNPQPATSRQFSIQNPQRGFSGQFSIQNPQPFTSSQIYIQNPQPLFLQLPPQQPVLVRPARPARTGTKRAYKCSTCGDKKDSGTGHIYIDGKRFCPKLIKLDDNLDSGNELNWTNLSDILQYLFLFFLIEIGISYYTLQFRGIVLKFNEAFCSMFLFWWQQNNVIFLFYIGFVFQSVCLSVCPSVRLSIRPSVHPSIFLVVGP